MKTKETLLPSLKEELVELEDKIKRLQTFEEDTTVYPGLSHTEQHELHFQLLAVEEYQYALQSRISYYEAN